MTHRKTILFTTLMLCVVGQHLCLVHAQGAASPPTPSAKGVVADIAKLPRLAVTTAGIANSIIRKRDPQDRESRVNRTYVQNYTSSLAVSADGFLYTDTTLPSGKGHAWRVRAVGPTESDWTHTITERAGPKVP